MRGGAVLVLATVLALALGTVLRVWRFDLAQVNFDEANAASLALAWKQVDAFPIMGTVSSVGIPAAPGWPWWVALGLWWSDDPLAFILSGVAAGVAAVFAVWFVARRWLGPWGGVGATLFYGTAFYAVLLDRGAWLPVFLQAPLVLCLDALLLLAVRRTPWALVAACGWLGILLNLHYTTIVYAALLPFAAWPARRWLRPLHVVLAAGVGLLPLVGFFVYQVHRDVGLRELSGLIGLSGGPSEVDLATVISVIQVSSLQGAAGLGGHATAELGQLLGRWTLVALLGPILAVAGLLVAGLVRPRGWIGWLIVAWTLLPVVVYARHGAGVIFHYMYIEFPGLALGVGALAAWAACRSGFMLRVGTGLAIGAYATVSAAGVVVLLYGLEQLDTRAGYGIPVAYSRAAGQLARAHVPPGGQVLIGDDPRNGEILRFTVGYDVPSRTFAECRGVPYAGNAVYLLASERTPGAGALEAAGAPLLGRVARPGGDAYRVYGPPVSAGPISGLEGTPEAGSRECLDRQVWEQP